MKKEIKTIIKKLSLTAAILACVISMAVVPVIPAMAEEESAVTGSVVSGQVTPLTEPATAYSQPDTSSEAVATFNAGDSVFLVSEEGDWYTIFYKGENLYIPKSNITSETLQAAEQQAQELGAQIDEELGLQEMQDESFVNAYYKMSKSRRNARIWIGVIVVLVAAVIAVSAIRVFKNKNKSEEKNEEKSEKVADASEKAIEEIEKAAEEVTEEADKAEEAAKNNH